MFLYASVTMLTNVPAFVYEATDLTTSLTTIGVAQRTARCAHAPEDERLLELVLLLEHGPELHCVPDYVANHD